VCALHKALLSWAIKIALRLAGVVLAFMGHQTLLTNMRMINKQSKQSRAQIMSEGGGWGQNKLYLIPVASVKRHPYAKWAH